MTGVFTPRWSLPTAPFQLSARYRYTTPNGKSGTLDPGVGEVLAGFG